MTATRSSSFALIGKILSLAGLFIGAAAVITQFPLTMSLSMAAGRTAFGSSVFFFSCFTILSNILAVACFAAALFSGQQGLAFFRRPKVRTAAGPEREAAMHPRHEVFWRVVIAAQARYAVVFPASIQRKS